MKKQATFILFILIILLGTVSIRSETAELTQDILSNEKMVSTEVSVTNPGPLQETNQPALVMESFYINLDNINDSIDLTQLDILLTKHPNITKDESYNLSDEILNATNSSDEQVNAINTSNEYNNITEQIENEPVPVAITNQTEILPEPIIENYGFYISTDKSQYFAGEFVVITIDAPDLMDVNVIISNDKDQYAYYYSGQKYPASYNFHLISTLGTYTVKAVLFADEPRTKSIEFEVFPDSMQETCTVHIDAPTRINQNNPVVFNAIACSSDESQKYTWNFDDETFAEGNQVIHNFREPGIYLVSLNVSDGENLSTDTLVVHVNPIQYQLVVEVQNPDGKLVTDAIVHLNSSAATTDMGGKATIDVTPGEYELTIEKQGFIAYTALKKIDHDEIMQIVLYDSIPIADVLAEIKENNNLKDIYIEDKSGVIQNEELAPEKPVNLVMTLDMDSSQAGAKPSEQLEVIVSLNDITPLQNDISKGGDIIVNTENLKLERTLENQGLIPQVVITLENVEDAFYDPYYYGTVQLDIAGIEYNKILFCPDDIIETCEIIEPCFNKKYYGGTCYNFSGSIVTIYVPHFSSVVIALDNRTANLNIISPDNATPLATGENISLIFSVNETVTASYSLDEGGFIELGTAAEFSARLIGILPYSILQNGEHSLTIFVKDDVNNTAQLDNPFILNDTSPPKINVTYNNTLLNNSVFINMNNSYTFLITSDEYAEISYLLNEYYFSSFTDLGNDKSISLSFQLRNSSNILILNVTDFQGNKAIYHYVFNYSAPIIENVTLNITTDKPRYNTSESVEIKVAVPQDVTVTISVIGGTTVYSQTHTGPITYIYTDTVRTGNYSVIGVMLYQGAVQTKTIMFEIVSPEQPYQRPSLSLTSDNTIVKEGATVAFIASVNGGKAPFTYRFDFNNDKTVDEMHSIMEPFKNVTYRYTLNGSYLVNVSVTDALGNFSYAERTIDVKKFVKLIFQIRDNKTDSPVNDVKVTLDGTSKYTNDTGGTIFELLQGLYDLSIQNENYYTHLQQLFVSNNDTVTIKINRTPESRESPEISLVSPGNNAVLSAAAVTFNYRAYDSSKMNCSLYTSSGDGWWILENTKYDITSGSQNSVAVADFGVGAYQWKVECVDEDGMSNTSATYSFILNLSNSLITQNSDDAGSEYAEYNPDYPDTELTPEQLAEIQSSETPNFQEIISEIIAFRNNFYLFSADENQVSEAINLEKMLEKAETEVTRAKRDLYNIVFRKLNDTEKEDLKKEIYQKLENLKDKTPKNLKVIEAHEFIKYPSAEDIKAVVTEVLSAKNISIPKLRLDAFMEENKELQKALTVLTKVKVVDIEFISGRKVTYTLIQKELQSHNISNATLVEFIPKELAKDLNETEFYVDYEILKFDPIVTINLAEQQKFAYFIKKRINYKDAENIKSILVSDKIQSKGLSKITGFGVFDKIKPLFLQSSHNRLIIEITIVIILVIIYLSYSLNIFRKFDIHNIALPIGKSHKLLKDMHDTVAQGHSYLKQNKYEEAKGMYKKASIAYKELPEKHRAEIKENILQLCYAVDVAYIMLMINQASELIAKNHKKQALPLYKYIQEVYKRIAPHYKAQVLQECTALYQKLK
jgi:hypothetical protein